MSSNNAQVSSSYDFRKTWQIILLSSVYIFVLLFNGLDEFVRSGFDLNFMLTGEWFYKVFRVLSSNLLIFMGTLFYLINKHMYENPIVVSRKKVLDKIIDEKLDAVTFDPFYLNFERERKKQFYKKDMEFQVEKLDQKANMKDLQVWNKHKKYPENKEYEESYLKNRYCQKKLQLMSYAQPDFIEEHIDAMKVPYKPNSKSFVTSGYNRPSRKGYDDYAVESKFEKLTRDLWSKFIIMIGSLIALESIVVEMGVTESLGMAFYNMVIKVLPLLLQLYMAYSYANTYIEEKVLVDISKRKDIMVRYLDSIKDKKGVEA